MRSTTELMEGNEAREIRQPKKKKKAKKATDRHSHSDLKRRL